MIVDELPPPSLGADAAALGVTLTDREIGLLSRFAGALLKWNVRFNLLSRRDIARLWPRHILDSLSIQPLLKGARVVDLGSGGGFPGMPLAITTPSVRFVLVDRHQRKCRFLEQTVAALGLENVDVVCADAVTLASDGERFDTVTSRALAPVAQVMALAEPLLSPQGRLLVMAAAGGQSSAAVPGSSVRRIEIPGLEQPHEVVILERPPAAGSAADGST